MKFPTLYKCVTTRNIHTWKIAVVDNVIVIMEGQIGKEKKRHETAITVDKGDAVNHAELKAGDLWYEKYEKGYWLSEFSARKRRKQQ